LIRSLSLACPKDRSTGLLGEPTRGDGVGKVSLALACKEGADFDDDSIVGNIRGVGDAAEDLAAAVGGIFLDVCGLASDAVEDRCGTACEDDNTAKAGFVDGGIIIPGLAFKPPAAVAGFELGPAGGALMSGLLRSGDEGVDKDVRMFGMGVVRPPCES
jgi:hypothetical protein